MRTWKRYMLLTLLAVAAIGQSGCAAVAGGVIGAVVAHEIVEDDDDE